MLSNWRTPLVALSLAALTAQGVLAQDTTMPAPAQTDQGSPANTTEAAEAQARDDTATVLEDAIVALEETSNAITALGEDRTDDAVAALERAIGKLEITLAANPDLALAPVDVTSSVIDIAATPEEITALRKQALRLMKDHQLQLARTIVTGLASEIDVTTTYIPLDTYPLALKSAAALAKDGKKDDALAVLDAALGTLVVVETVVPLPLIRAQFLIDQAKGLSEKADRSAEEAARLASLLDQIDTEIARGEALEYGGAGAFDDIKAEMRVIRDKLADGGSGEGFFDRLRGLFSQVGRDHAAASQ